MPFKPGQSGNPAGRSKGKTKFKELCEKYSVEALEIIRDMMTSAEDDGARLKACIWIAEQAYGKASQSVEMTGKDGQPLQAVINIGKPPDQ